jgi:hypothetical protein
MSTNPNPDYFFNNPQVDTSELYGADGSFYSADARAVRHERTLSSGEVRISEHWFANFFPDLTVWDRLERPGGERGAGVQGNINFPNSVMKIGLMVLLGDIGRPTGTGRA